MRERLLMGPRSPAHAAASTHRSNPRKMSQEVSTDATHFGETMMFGHDCDSAAPHCRILQTGLYK